MFAQLVVYWNADPVMLQLGGLTLRWYGLLFALGFVLGWFLFKWFFKTEKLDQNLLDPLFVTVIVATVVGARLGHCIFYQPDYYFGSWSGFWEIFMPWKGGLASHGGTIALIIAMWWFARHYGRKYDFDFLWMLDHLCIPVCFAGMFIRLGNLFNSEIYGDVTSLPWGFIFLRAGETVPHHPTQIYEALSYLILGLILLGMYRYKLEDIRRGTFIGIFFIVLFGMRFLIEFIKEPQVGFEKDMLLNMGQLLSIPFILIGIFLLMYAKYKDEPAMIVHPVKKGQSPTHYAHGTGQQSR